MLVAAESTPRLYCETSAIHVYLIVSFTGIRQSSTDQMFARGRADSFLDQASLNDRSLSCSLNDSRAPSNDAHPQHSETTGWNGGSRKMRPRSSTQSDE